MSERKLTKIVEELTGHLDDVDDPAALDPEARRALLEAVAAIRGALESEEPSDSLLSGLRERLERFEGDHPTITETVRRLVDQLAEMAI